MLLNTVMKFHDKILRKKLRIIMEPTSNLTQCGFKKVSDAENHIFRTK